MKTRTVIAAGLLGAAALAGGAEAATYSFTNITGNNATNAAAGEAQLRVDVDAVAGDPTQVLFTFYHDGSTAMSITDVYFDDGTLLGIASIINGSGVDFSQGASPGNLPGGNTIGFVATAGFTADSNAPTQPNGVNPGESLGIVFDLINGKTFADVLDALTIGFPEGGLVIGIHVQGYGDGGSEGFITGGPGTMVPLPGGALLGLAGLAPLTLRRRR